MFNRSYLQTGVQITEIKRPGILKSKRTYLTSINASRAKFIGLVLTVALLAQSQTNSLGQVQNNGQQLIDINTALVISVARAGDALFAKLP